MFELSREDAFKRNNELIPESLIWNGSNSVEFCDFLGHHDFTHKRGILTVNHDGDVIEIAIGETLYKNADGSMTKCESPTPGLNA